MRTLRAFGRTAEVPPFFYLTSRCVCVFFPVIPQGQGEASARGTTMEGDCLSCIKYLMFVFNFLIFVSIPPSLPPFAALSQAISGVSVCLIDWKWAPRCPLPDCLMEPHLHFIRRRQSWCYQTLLWLDFSVLTHIWGTLRPADVVTGTWVYQSWSDNQGQSFQSEPGNGSGRGPGVGWTGCLGGAGLSLIPALLSASKAFRDSTRTRWFQTGAIMWPAEQRMNSTVSATQ